MGDISVSDVQRGKGAHKQLIIDLSSGLRKWKRQNNLVNCQLPPSVSCEFSYQEHSSDQAHTLLDSSNQLKTNTCSQ